MTTTDLSQNNEVVENEMNAGVNDMGSAKRAEQPVCRACGSDHLQVILSFGETPLADALLTEQQLAEDEIFAPLDLAVCPDCSLAQITAPSAL